MCWNVWVFIPYLSQAVDAGFPKNGVTFTEGQLLCGWGRLWRSWQLWLPADLTFHSWAAGLAVKRSLSGVFLYLPSSYYSIKWEDHHPYPRGVTVGVQWDCTFEVFNPVVGGNNCSIILSFKTIEQIVFSPKPVFFLQLLLIVIKHT